HPVPETAAGGGVRVQACHHEAAGLRREARPRQVGGEVLAPHAGVGEPKIHRLALDEVVAGERERGHGGEMIVRVRWDRAFKAHVPDLRIPGRRRKPAWRGREAFTTALAGHYPADEFPCDL